MIPWFRLQQITCDPGYLDKKILGAIQSVVRTTDTTTFTGWSCNDTSSAAIQVKVYAYGSPIVQEEMISSKSNPKLKKTGINRPIKVFRYITQKSSNIEPDATIAFKCGKLSKYARRFSITVNNSDISQYTNHKLYIKGISNSGGVDKYIKGSGVHYIIPHRTQERTQVSKF